MNWDWEKLQQKNQQKRQQSTGDGGGGMPPEMDELFKKMKEFKFSGGSILIVAAIIVIYFGMTTVFKVNTDEVGVIQRFGKYVRTVQPGLQIKLPNGIERLTKVRVTRVEKEEFGFRAVRTTRNQYSSENENIAEALMLTGDLNVALVPWIVQYRVKDPYQFLFKVSDVKRLLRDMAEATMRLVVGDRSINEVISKREEMAAEAKILLQEELDKAEAGINIVAVEMKKTNVPTPVQPSFNEVNQATQEKEKLIYQAKEDYNKAIPEARGEAERVVKAAEGYAMERVNRAKGDASRFVAFYNAYSKAKDVTKRRMYLEMVKELFPRLDNKYIIDSDQKNVLPFLNLEKQSGVVK